MLYDLRGNFDIPILSNCTLACTGCTYLDYMNSGCTIDSTMRLDNIQRIIENLKRLEVRLYRITFLGGEPTIHPEFLEMAKLLSCYKNVIYKELKLITNGTQLNEDFIKSLDYIDSVRVTIYPSTVDIRKAMDTTGLSEYISSKCQFGFLYVSEFEDYGTKQSELEYSQQLNWKRCTKKNWCRILTEDTVYKCGISYNHRSEGCSYESRDEFIKYIENQTHPLDLCENCPTPPNFVPWSSNNEERDTKMVKRGIQIISNWRETII